MREIVSTGGVRYVMCDVPSLSDKTCAAEYYRQSNCEEEKCVSSYFGVRIFAKNFDFFILRKKANTMKSKSMQTWDEAS